MKCVILVLVVSLNMFIMFDECVHAGENMNALFGSLYPFATVNTNKSEHSVFLSSSSMSVLFFNTIVDLFLIPHRVRVFLTNK